MLAGCKTALHKCSPEVLIRIRAILDELEVLVKTVLMMDWWSELGEGLRMY